MRAGVGTVPDLDENGEMILVKIATLAVASQTCKQ
jgi:hypothetical protein